MSLESHTRLSETGQRRREAMLGELIDAMHQHHRVRRTRRTVAALGTVACVAVGALYFVANANTKIAQSPVQVALSESNKPAAESVARSVANIARVETEAGLAERYRAMPTNQTVVIGDAELIDALRRADRPAGLVRIGGDVYLTASVVDQPLRTPDRPNSL